MHIQLQKGMESFLALCAITSREGAKNDMVDDLEFFHMKRNRKLSSIVRFFSGWFSSNRRHHRNCFLKVCIRENHFKDNIPENMIGGVDSVGGGHN